MVRFGDGLARGPDLTRAAAVASAQALVPLAGQRPDLAFVFVCGPDADEVADAGVRAATATGARAVLGCSAPGVIGAGHGVERGSAVAVWCGVLPGVRVRTFHLEVMPASGGMAVVGLPERQDDDAVGVLLADPWSFPIDGFVERSNEALAHLPLVGGLAAGQRGRGSTRLFLDGRAVDRGAVGVLLSGPVGARTFVSHGCRPVGPPMTVTAADGNVLLELAGAPARRKLEEVVAQLPPADQALASGGLQLGIAIDEYNDDHDRGDFLVRGIAGVDEDRDGLVVGDLVEVGTTVRLQVRDASSADEDLRSTLRRFREATPLETVEGALVFTCNGRGSDLFDSSDHDIRLIRAGLGAAQGIAGFFAAGEIGPVGGRNHVHGVTAAVLAFGSRAGSGQQADAVTGGRDGG